MQNQNSFGWILFGLQNSIKMLNRTAHSMISSSSKNFCTFVLHHYKVNDKNARTDLGRIFIIFASSHQFIFHHPRQHKIGLHGIFFSFSTNTIFSVTYLIGCTLSYTTILLHTFLHLKSGVNVRKKNIGRGCTLK